jgi:hypothetical protein
MKTTIDIPDSLYKRCKDIIRREGTTLRSIIEEGLFCAIQRHEHPEKFSFKPLTFKGKGLSKEFENGGWNAIRSEIYKGRGE